MYGEGEELYGPDKEAPTRMISDLVPVEISSLPNANNIGISTSNARNVTFDALHKNVGENSSTSSEPKIKAKEEQNNGPKFDKKSRRLYKRAYQATLQWGKQTRK